MRELRPVGTQLSNLLVNAGQARRPTSTSSSSGSTALIPASVKGLPAQSRFLDQTRNVLGAAGPVPAQLQPVLRASSASTSARSRRCSRPTPRPPRRPTRSAQDRVHYLRLTEPGEPGGARHLSAAARTGAAATRTTSRATTTSCAGGLPVFNGSNCGPDGFPTRPAQPEPGGGVPQPDRPVRAERREHRRAAVPRAGAVHGRRTASTRLPARATRPEAEPVAAA